MLDVTYSVCYTVKVVKIQIIQGGQILKTVDVFYKKNKDLTVPTQGYEGDFAYDVYAGEGRLVPPLTFKSVIIPTDLQTAFNEKEVGMHLALRSGASVKTPLIMSNAPGIIEGTYRNKIGIIVRNTFIDNSLVDFVIDINGKRVPLIEVPNSVKKAARAFYEEETELLGYEGIEKSVQKIAFRSVVPRGTIYVPKGARIAQMYFAPKYKANFVEADTLPDSERGLGGFGSSGTTKK